MMQQVLREITPVTDKDCFLLFYRTKKKFDFPLHTHEDYEINLIIGAKGALRVIGDSTEVIGDLDLTLVANPNLEHAWLNHECTSDEVQELTIQFHKNLISEENLAKTVYHPIARLLKKAQNGVTFSEETIKELFPKFEKLLEQERGLKSVLLLLDILNDLALSKDIRVLATDGIRGDDISHHDSRRIEQAYNFMHNNYQKEIYLKDVANHVGMSEVAFSRFVKRRMNKNFIDVLLDIRLGHASKMLVDTTHTIAEICFACGFNNLSNFNRVFKRKKDCTPTEFRERFKKNRYLL